MKNYFYKIAMLSVVLGLFCTSCKKDSVQAPTTQKQTASNSGKTSGSDAQSSAPDPGYTPSTGGCPAHNAGGHK